MKERTDLLGNEIVSDLAEKLKARMEEKINAVKEIASAVTAALKDKKPRRQRKDSQKFNFSQVSLSLGSATEIKIITPSLQLIGGVKVAHAFIKSITEPSYWPLCKTFTASVRGGLGF